MKFRDIKLFLAAYDPQLKIRAFKLSELINDNTKHRKNPKVFPIKARVPTKPGFSKYSRFETKFVLTYMQNDDAKNEIWNIYYKLIQVSFDDTQNKLILNVEETEQNHRRKLNKPISLFKFMKSFGTPEGNFFRKASASIGPICHYGYKYNMKKKRCEINKCDKTMRGCLHANDDGTKCQ